MFNLEVLTKNLENNGFSVSHFKTGKEAAEYLNKEIDIIVEEPVEVDGKEYMTGYTKEYVRVVSEIDKNHCGSVYKGVAKKMLNDEIILL